MTNLDKLISETIEEEVPTTELRESILQAISLQKKFGDAKSIDLISKYEKIVEGLVK